MANIKAVMLRTMMVGLLASGSAVLGSAVNAAESVKIAFIDPLSGPFATVGSNGLAEWKYAAEKLVNEKGGVLGGRNFEVVSFDNKMSGKESLIQLKVAIDRGIRIIAQGNSSGIANAITTAVAKHNKRNPDKRVLYLNYSAVDPALTNDKCHFYHFRFDANADIKMDVLTDVMAKNDKIKNVYIIGQDYSFGKAVAAAAVRNIAVKMPEAKIVGNELHPFGKVKDFTPYARKIMAANTDAVITGNFGSDMVSLGKAIIQAGYKGPIYTYYAYSNGITKTFGADGKNVIRLVAEGSLNPPASARSSAYIRGFEAKFPDFDITQARITNAVEMLAKAINDAGSVDIVRIAYALEGMEHPSIWGGNVKMRSADHQAIQNVHVQTHTDEGITHKLDNSDYGLIREGTIVNAGMDSSTTCKMERP